jgi:hypothetical protein
VTRILLRLALVTLGIGIPYLAAEGVHSLVSGGRPATSLAYEVYARWFAARGAAFDPHDPTTWVITQRAQFDAMRPLLLANGVGIGNAPYRELRSAAVAINRDVEGCTEQKPDQHKVMAFLRSNLFNPFDQPTYFYDADRVLPPELQQFFDRHGFRRVHLTSNGDGERVTLPVVEADDIVLVAGDSVANGAMLDDSETISSRLQERDPRRRYVNIGIVGAKTSDTACALERAARRYRGRIRELLYIFCENDFDDATAGEIIAGLVAFTAREKIRQVVLVYMPYIYNVVPEITRIRGHSHYDFPTYRDEKRALLARARQAGFAIVDFVDIANDEQQALATQFAPLALYIDHTHPSPRGVRRLVSAIDAVRRHAEQP